jgi:hypothetical protein
MYQLVFSWPALAAGLQPDRLPVRIAVNEALGPVERVAKWDPASPQELVRIDGDLFQESDGFYYRVVEDRISVRLADGVADWNDLVGRAFASDPGAYADLPDLVVERSNRLGIVDLILPGGDPTEWCERIFRTGLVRYAEVATFGVFLATANDPYYPQQWALRNTGQSGGVPGADIDAELAWDLTTGNPDIVVGVLDSGTYITHPDLDLNVWHNDDEIPNNGVDDDGNGFIDDVDGWDFPNNNNNVASNNFHGTHVTGIIVAEGNNNLGVVGLVGGLGSPGVRAMAVAVGESYPVTSVMDDAMLYAVDNGAQVVTMSLSVGQTSAFDNALDYAYNTKDVFIDCAAGNNGSSVTYPATRGEVMAVAASTRYDTHASFSNPGPQLEVTAPGQDIYSTQLGGSYGSSSGTSFAAPYVGALAAMIRGVNSGMSAPDVRQLIIDTAEDIESPGFDNLTGWGRINAYAAVSQAGFSDGTIELDAELYSCSQVVRLTVMDFDLGGSGSVAVTVKSGPEPDGETVFLTETAEFGVFSGALPLATGTPGTDGLLQVVHDDTIVAEYVDADDGQGGINVVKTDAATTDCAGPAIAGVTVLGVDDSMAGIRWTTDEPGTTVVRYGITVPPDQQSASDVLTLVHLAQLTDLEECTTYKFSVESADGFGNVTEDDNGGEYYSFQTWGYFPGVGVVPCRLGQAELDRTVYGCGGTAEATVVDIDLDADSAATDTVDIWMTSTSEPAGEWITLTETATDSGTFTGSIGLDDVTAGPDGVLAVATGDLITATYFDEDDGVQGPQTATATATVDCNPPAIRDVRVTALSATRAEIEWTTDKPATSRVEFGPDATLGSVVEDPELKTAHRLAISAFEACDRAFFRVSGVGEHGAVSVADVAGEPFEFNLDEIGGLVFHDNFEDDRGWSFTGEWERGTPQGQGSGSGDPVLAYSGSGVLGNDLTGTGAYPGDYEPGALEWAFSPSLDTVGIADPELILRRKLGVAPGDSATIAVEVLLQQQVWSSKAGGLDDPEWIELRYPIPAAGDKPAVRVGFSLQSDGDGHSYGWNIDEMIVKDSNEPDYRACGGCSGPPSFGGLAAVYDPDPCGPSGLTLEWQPAPAWGTGTGGTYDVHRGTTPDFVPDASNRIASDLVATTWIDATAPVDTQVWYVVRARNDEDCTGGEGLADGNLVRGTATETLDQALPPGLGATVQVTSIGAAHVRLVWDPVAGADHYVVRRSESADFGAAQVIGTASETLFEDVNALIDESSYFYRVFAANACGEEAP